MAGARKVSRSVGGNLFVFAVLLVTAIFMVFPLVYSISASLKPLNELWIFPPRFFVQNPTAKNFKDLLSLMSDSWVPFSRYIFNTVLITAVGTAGHILLSSMCAFSICKLKFPGHNAVFRMVVYSLMFSTAVTAIPGFLVINLFGMVNTYWALLLPAFASSLGLYLMKQFMESMIPDSLLEAARIDGAGDPHLFFRIVMPIVRPAWLTLLLFSFQHLWNVGSTPLIQSESLKTLNYAISQIVTGGIARAGTASAATVVMMAVPIAVFVFTQSNVVETMATSGMKG